MNPEGSSQSTTPDVVGRNRRFYDALWWRAHLQNPKRFNTWPLVSALLPYAPSRLELGPGLRPRLPIAGTHFIDVSAPVVDRLNARGGIAVAAEVGALPFGDGYFDLVCAFDVIEHVEDDRLVFAEVSRVLKVDGVLVLSVPIHRDLWTDVDEVVGHVRRYEPSELTAILASNRLDIEQSAAFGMQPSDLRWVRCGMWYLEHRPDWAMFWYNWVGMPLAMLFQKRLPLAGGVIDTTGIDEIALVCRRRRMS